MLILIYISEDKKYRKAKTQTFKCEHVLVHIIPVPNSPLCLRNQVLHV